MLVKLLFYNCSTTMLRQRCSFWIVAQFSSLCKNFHQVYPLKNKTKIYFFLFILLERISEGLRWLTCKTYGFHWFALHFYVLLKQNKLAWQSYVIANSQCFRYTLITNLNICNEPARCLIIAHVCFSYVKAYLEWK